MKFIAGLRVWGNWGIGENVLKVFLRLRGSANRRVDLFLPLIASIWNQRKVYRHLRLARLWPSRRFKNEAIYERGVVKRGGADFASRVPAHPLRRRLRSILPISDLSADDSGVHPATHPLSPRPRESFLPQCRQCTKR